MIGSIPGILLSSRYTVSVPQNDDPPRACRNPHRQRGQTLRPEQAPPDLGLRLAPRHARGRGRRVHVRRDARRRARLGRNRPNRFLNRSAVESARFAAGPLDGRASGPAPGQRCRLRDHRAPEAHQEPDLRATGDEQPRACSQPPTPIEGVFSPVCHCATGKAVISFKLRHRDSVTVTIVDSATERRRHAPATADSRRTNARHVPLERPYHRGGRSRRTGPCTGRRSISRTRGGRSVMPNKITVDTSAPKVISASDGAGILVPGAHHGIAIHYTLGEKAHAAVYVRGRRVVLGRRTATDGKVKWSGKVGGKDAAAGPLRARGRGGRPRRERDAARRTEARRRPDPADRSRRERRSTSGPAPASRSRSERTPRTTRGGSPAITAPRKTKLLHLHAPAHRGRYRLVVTAHGRSATAIVIVGPKK